MIRKLVVRILAVLLVAGPFAAAYVAAQDTQETSVADAARRAREQKKNGKPRVITNESIPPATNEPKEGQAGPESQPTPAATKEAAPPEPPARESATESTENADKKKADAEEKQKAQVESLKRDITEKRSEVDLAQRELALANDSYYSKPNFAEDKQGKTKLDGLQAELNQKKDELAQLKAKLAELGAGENTQAPASSPQP